MHSKIVESLCNLAADVDAREDCTRNHSKEVCKYAIAIARDLGYSDQDIDRLRISALLHDIGKIGLVTSDKLLSSNDTEWQRIRAHPYIAVVMLRNLDELKECIPAIHYHHERFDGTGYPDKLKGDDIPLDARIIAVADTFDAMISPRLYRDAHPLKDALDYIEREAGAHFDPMVVNVFLHSNVAELASSIS